MTQVMTVTLRNRDPSTAYIISPEPHNTANVITFLPTPTEGEQYSYLALKEDNIHFQL